jgi:AcrR family transcriptional regulator
MEVTAVGDRDTTAGRPRQAELDDRIKQSAVAILGAHGFAGLSINRICQHAGIPRPTFYRRWPSAIAALVDAFNDRFDDALLVDDGDVTADLIAFAIAVRNRYDDPVVGTCLPAIYEARRAAPELIAPIIDAQRRRRKANVATLARALGEQGIASILSPFEILFAITAAIDQGYLARRPVADDFLHRLVAALLR